ncbi:aldehyde dehydrogenase (NADP(+)) [Pseudomonas sp. Sample_24]|uniref:aldehyde dehydrogenase (NADP(+)) n=1 Tax=Pseudomonas sp. Sample_24 TaxID=2448268 RepID=UPI001032F0F3|nr:aldehyde dehydrogenase (NADP(+)) [Pseudomonas sp. Sample_24]
MSDILGQQFIDGQRSALGRETLHSVDASSGQALPYVFHQATEQEVALAVAAATRAFAPFRQLPPGRRADFLEAIADEIDGLGEEFIALVCRETALPEGRIRGERGRTSGQLRLFAQVLKRGDFLGARIDQALPERLPLPRADIRQYRIGVGPVAVFGASNFPLAFSTAGGDTASALAAGCPVVFKAHSGHMATADCVASAIVRAAQRTGMPSGVFNMIYGAGVGQALVKAEGIKAVGFTGSLKGGRALSDLAAARPQPIPVFAEMSSINPVILLPHALSTRGDKIAAELTASVNLGCGQFCTSPGLIIGLRSAQFSEFQQHFAQHMGDQPAQTMLNAGALNSYSAGLKHLDRHAQVDHLAGQPQGDRQAQPQLFKADVQLLLEGDPLLQEEIFGPATVLVEVDDSQQLRAVLDSLHGQLTATLIAEPADLERYSDLLPLLEDKVGRLLLNGYPTGVEVSDAMVHGGPYPATSDARGTSVGSLAIDRFLRPVCYQNYPDEYLPEALQNHNPLGLNRLVNGQWSRASLI